MTLRTDNLDLDFRSLLGTKERAGNREGPLNNTNWRDHSPFTFLTSVFNFAVLVLLTILLISH
jgi:hypothetical protein